MLNKTQITRRLQPIILLCLVAAFLFMAFISQPSYHSKASPAQAPVPTKIPPCSTFRPCGDNILAIADAYTERTFPDWNFGASTRLNISSDSRLVSVYESFVK